jgi:putative hydrolase of the HAD superfamily
MVIRGIVFDIDDTLYLERDYVRSGFDHVAQMLATSNLEARGIADWLWTAFEAGVRGDTFNRLLATRTDLAGRATVADIVDGYRGHRPRIRLLEGTPELLALLRGNGLRLGVLSDGPLVSQQAKTDALKLGKWFDPILLTAARDGFKKPATGGFEWIATKWSLPPTELAYVGDNPNKDFVGPRKLGWRTVRLHMPQQVTYALQPTTDDQGPDADVTDLSMAVNYLTS